MLTTKEVAERIGVKYTTVMLWLRENKLAGAVKEGSPRGDYWLIPESSIAGIQKRGQGRPKKTTQLTNGAPVRTRHISTKKAKKGASLFLASQVTSNVVTDSAIEKKNTAKKLKK